jgi:hypothetical protein
MMPGDELAAGVEARLDMVRGRRTIFAIRHIVLAAPDQLDRLSHRLGEAQRVHHDFLLAAAAKTTAQHMLMQRELGAIGLQQIGGLVEQARRALRAGPDLGRLAVGAHGSGRVQRLHLRMVDKACAVFAAVDACRTRHRGFGVADRLVGHACARLVATHGSVVGERRFAVVLRTGRRAPGDLEHALRGLRSLD